MDFDGVPFLFSKGYSLYFMKQILSLTNIIFYHNSNLQINAGDLCCLKRIEYDRRK